MLDTHDALRLLVQAYPWLRAELVRDVADWLQEDGMLSPCMILASASHVVADRISQGQFDALPELFGVIEQLLVEGTHAVKDAAATCFLENLTNRGSLDARLYVPFMGEESKAYCRAWDAFTGIRTPGLYEEG